MGAPPNPIEVRLGKLYEQWGRFAADAERTVLRWLIRDDERRMLEALLAIEDDEEGELDALFFVFNTPFEPRRYGYELRREFDRRLKGMDEAFAGLGLGPWVTSASEATVSDIGLLMQTSAALTGKLQELVETVALVLWPNTIADPQQFAEWLRRAARVVPPGVRLVVIDRAEAPLLAALEGERVQTVIAELDMAGALEELAAAAPDRASAGGRFREAFVAMSAALAREQPDAAQQHGARALAVAREAGFDHLEVAVPFALGGGLLATGDVEGSVAQFRLAEQTAAAAPPDSSWGPRVHLQAQLGLAGALVGARAWRLAAEAYTSAASSAMQIDDRGTQVEALRMAAWSHERGGMFEDAWVLALVGLEVAEGMDAEALERSTVPWLGELLLRSSDRGAMFEHERPAVARRLARLLGAGWRRS